LDELYKDIEALSARSAVVVLDACYTGNSSRSGKALIKGGRDAVIRPKTPDAGENTVVFHATTEQTSWMYKEVKHGLFTYYFLKGLGGSADVNSDGEISVEELGNYTHDNVKEYAATKLKQKQEPNLQLPVTARKTKIDNVLVKYTH
jgi:uncharacterized caspase-like protein